MTIIAWFTSSEFLNHWVTIPTSSVVNTPPTIIQSAFKAIAESNRNDPVLVAITAATHPGILERNTFTATWSQNAQQVAIFTSSAMATSGHDDIEVYLITSLLLRYGSNTSGILASIGPAVFSAKEVSSIA